MFSFGGKGEGDIAAGHARLSSLSILILNRFLLTISFRVVFLKMQMWYDWCPSGLIQLNHNEKLSILFLKFTKLY